jgi:hypothetical protein
MLGARVVATTGGDMGLMDRLKAAQAAREGTDSEVIDLTDEKAEEVEPTVIWGRPSKCPACGESGYLDRIDLVQRMMYQHCPSCLHRWDIHESATVRLVER